jgi:hypothetical protein
MASREEWWLTLDVADWVTFMTVRNPEEVLKELPAIHASE